MTDDQPLPDRLAEKLADVIAQALINLPADDVIARVAYCQRTGEHGIRVFTEGESVRLVWGGADLALVERDVLIDDVADLPPGEWIPAAPDFVPPEWSGE